MHAPPSAREPGGPSSTVSLRPEDTRLDRRLSTGPALGLETRDSGYAPRPTVLGFEGHH